MANKDRILHIRVTGKTIARIDEIAALFGAAGLSQAAVVSMAVEQLHSKLTGEPPPASQLAIDRLASFFDQSDAYKRQSAPISANE
jgi:hypothetical protein